mmetsp:Transcript_14736/g.35969  ORF Transcript_14736/g.35969 Transcript_14736/m.35969 type:complete len:161 (+) Transcript_14736:136-618(+)
MLKKRPSGGTGEARKSRSGKSRSPSRRSRRIAEREGKGAPEMKQAIARLQTGSMTFKHTSKGSKQRWVQLSETLRSIDWLAPEGTKRRGGILLSEIVAIAPGWQTSVFQVASQKMKPAQEETCLSIVCGNKTLDLEMETVAVRNQWVKDVSLVTGKKALQ